jgi:hypothetical protein
MAFFYVTLVWINKLPSLADCKEMVRKNNFSWDKGLPLLYRYSKVEDLPESEIVLEEARDANMTQRSQEEPRTEGKQTIWARNNIKPAGACK